MWASSTCVTGSPTSCATADDQAPVELLGMQVIDELIKDEVQYYKDIYKERGIKGLMESL